MKSCEINKIMYFCLKNKPLILQSFIYEKPSFIYNSKIINASTFSLSENFLLREHT